MKGIVSILLLLILIGAISCQPYDMDEGICGGIFFDYPPEPSIPKAIPTPDPHTYEPLQILYIPFHPMPIEQREMHLYREAFDYVNGKLSKILKTTRLKDARLPRVLQNNSSTCDRPYCSYLELPDKFALPCYNNESKLGPNLNATVDEGVQEYNPSQYSLVIYVVLRSQKECRGHAISYATNCRRGDLLRPTHGLITFCQRPIQMKKASFLNIFLHETLHVLMTKLDGRFIPQGQLDDKYGNEKAVENIMWKYITREWALEPSDPDDLTNVTIPVTITPNVLNFVRDHFDCDTVEGAELALILTMNNRVRTKANHWSFRLFSDDILSPGVENGPIPAARISGLTLSFAKDTKWYEVDMSYAEPLVITRPQERGCDLATKSCHEILKILNTSKSTADQVYAIRPFCDLNEDVITPLCSRDGMWRLQCHDYSNFHETLFCDITLEAPNAPPAEDIDHPKCAEASDQPFGHAIYGLKVGPNTMCITFIDPLWNRNYRLFPACVAYECKKESLVLKFEYEDIECDVPIAPGEFDNKLANITFKRGSDCDFLLARNFKFIGPEVNVICPGISTKTPTTKRRITSTEMATRRMTTSGSGFTKNRFLVILMILGFKSV